MKVKMRMPDLSATESEVTISQWLIEEGSAIVRGEPLMVVETDKAAVEVESIVGGVLTEICAEAGKTVETGSIVAVFESEITAMDTAPRSSPEVAKAPAAIEEAPPAASRTLMPDLAPAALSVQSIMRYERQFLLSLYERMVLIRDFEDGVKFLFLEGFMPGTIHQCQGQEATAVGVCAALRPEDFITSTFRGHGHALARGLTPEEILIELFGAGTGCCKGKGGSMHIGNMEKGMIPAIAIVGGSIPLAAGMGLAYRMKKTDQVVACFFGDGATSEGAFYEGLNLAAIWNVPAIFVCENNLYGASTRLDLVTRVPRIADRAPMFGIRGDTVDGNDVLAVYEAANRAAEECRAGKGPVLLELLTYRRTGHSRRDACHYQPDEEKEIWFQRDPIERLESALLQRSDVSANDLDGIRLRVVKQYEAALDAFLHSGLITKHHGYDQVVVPPPA